MLAFVIHSINLDTNNIHLYWCSAFLNCFLSNFFNFGRSLRLLDPARSGLLTESLHVFLSDIELLHANGVKLLFVFLAELLLNLLLQGELLAEDVCKFGLLKDGGAVLGCRVASSKACRECSSDLRVGLDVTSETWLLNGSVGWAVDCFVVVIGLGSILGEELTALS